MRFNGATSFQKWRQEELDPSWAAVYGFQWSHFFSEMETVQSRWEHGARTVVSMEPLLFRNGDARERKSLRRKPSVSMEPLLFRNGDGTFDDGRTEMISVSMEPLLFRNGDT